MATISDFEIIKEDALPPRSNQLPNESLQVQVLPENDMNKTNSFDAHVPELTHQNLNETNDDAILDEDQQSTDESIQAPILRAKSAARGKNKTTRTSSQSTRRKSVQIPARRKSEQQNFNETILNSLYKKFVEPVIRYMISATVIGFLTCFILFSILLSILYLFHREQIQGQQNFNEKLIHRISDETEECLSNLQTSRTSHDSLLLKHSECEDQLGQVNLRLKEIQQKYEPMKYTKAKPRIMAMKNPNQLQHLK